MGSNPRVKYDAKTRRAAAKLFSIGYGFRATSTKLGIPPGTVRRWRSTYASAGLEGLLVMGSKHRTYTFEQKVAAAKAVVEGGEAAVDVMVRFDIASPGPLERWCKAYREGGPEALRPRPKGRPKGSKAQPKELTREEELEIRVRKLEAENAYLKKLEALRAEEALRTGSRPRW